MGVWRPLSQSSKSFFFFAILFAMVLPAIPLLASFAFKLHIGDYFSGEAIIEQILIYQPILAEDITVFKPTDALPVLLAAALIALLPQVYSVTFKAISMSICIVGYLTYARLASILGTVEAIPGFLNSALTPDQMPQDSDPLVIKRINFVAIASVISGFRLIFLIIGGALLGITVKKQGPSQ